MLDPGLTVAFLAFAGLLIVSPGPDTLIVLANGLRHGPRGAIAAALGGAFGSLIHATAAAIGIGALIMASPLVFEAERWTGALYLAVLGAKALASALKQPPPIPAGKTIELSEKLPDVFRHGVLTSLLNPKMSAFYLAVLPQFANPELGQIGLQMFLLGCIHNTLGTAYLVAIGIGAGRFATYLSRTSFRRWLDAAAGAFFVGLAIRLALQERPSR